MLRKGLLDQDITGLPHPDSFQRENLGNNLRIQVIGAKADHKSVPPQGFTLSPAWCRVIPGNAIKARRQCGKKCGKNYNIAVSVGYFSYTLTMLRIPLSATLVSHTVP